MTRCLLIALLFAGCGDDGAPLADSSTTTDSAAGDSGAPPDSSVLPDAATDASTDAAEDAATDASTDAAGDAATDASTDAAGDAATDGSTDAAGDAGADATVDASTGLECTADSDCRAFSSYCEGCTCLALLVGEPDPVCGGTTVTCFVDPCSTVGPVRCRGGSGTCGFAGGGAP